MENAFGFEGSSVSCGISPASTDLKDELITSLTSFLRVYSQRRDLLRRSSESFSLTAARLHEMHEDISENKTFHGLFSVFGGLLGAACGSVTGGIGGALGAVSAATCARFCGDISAVDATVGFVGSTFGGAVGGTFTGTVGGAICAGRPVHKAVSDIVLFAIGCATGGAIGGVFGGTVGTAGGAIGGAFGGLYATRFAVYLVGHFCEKVELEEQKIKAVKTSMMRQSGDFSENIKPLMDELKTVKTMSDQMASREVVHSVGTQTVKTLISVTTMQKMISDCQRTTDLPQIVSSFGEVSKQSQKVTKELEQTRAEVDKLLVLLKKY
ncbi:keratin, type I cytoskeletal 9 [Plectropomus leopardus]|uniref:keratin, type I cytoskeletal 9 n=1 Tax=Plectropomus leopardus TaxID=160734 RepID=UPI001C4B0AA7|nr:keratin, type I cytoskeletal 9 [Plectropomus leopardus]XP_042364404.1 keratin, type I cytoskeletal 9 [Plectropomus leopardus]